MTSATPMLQAVAAGAERRQIDWLPAVWVSILIGLCYHSVLRALVHQWHANEDMGHGPFVPLFAAYVIWERRGAIMAALAAPEESGRGRTIGLLMILGAFLQFTFAVLAAELFLQRTAILVSIAGAVLYLGGSRLFRTVSFPLALLLFSIPLPGIALKAVTFPLQLLSSQIAEQVLELIGYTVVRDGNVLELAGQELSVAEACSGIRAILSLSFFSICYGYLVESRQFFRWMLLAITIPVAVFANSGRIVFLGILGEIDRKLATGFLHAASGWVIFVISIALLILVHRVATAIRPDPAEMAE